MSTMREMQLHYLYFTMYALWMQVLLLPQWTQGLSCFSCNSKTDENCNNKELAEGFRKNMFSTKCSGSDAVCVKESIVVQNYYEEKYSRLDMKKYYRAMDKAAECRGIGMSGSSGVTSAPDGSGTTTGSAAGRPGGTTAAASGGGDSQDGAAAEAGETGTTPEVAAGDVAPEAAADADPAARRRRAVGEDCPAFPSEFPTAQAVVERTDQRWVYSCGNRSDWETDHHMGDCHTHNDGILRRTTCVCDRDLCNGATLPMPGAGPFLVLAAALAHLQSVIG